jgi:hypothetical protein
MSKIKLNPTKEKFSFREMEHIAVNYAIIYQKGYTGTFRDYMKGINKDWRKWLKEKDLEESKKVDTKYQYIPINEVITQRKDVAEEFYKDYVSNGCDCLQMSCPICHG